MSVTPPLACTVRDCGLFLERHDGVLRCARRHSYDVAKTGYINLLQPQDRKSLQAGDTPDAVMARSRLVQAGVGARLISTLTDRVARLVAERVGATDLRHTIYTTPGGNTPQALVNRTCLDIARGDVDVVLVGGAEAWRTRRGRGSRMRTACRAKVELTSHARRAMPPRAAMAPSSTS